ncbi:unnamed protein product [marine sediment metagenome]|uniref:Uncharacterized protein n=1 Tax=marine sediment metagenome TaxID=412755 RepID=X1LP60_9ZZZZ
MSKLKDSPQYIRNLLLPRTKSPAGRRVWSIDLETVWLPFFTATNTMGDTAIPADALGSPIRLAYDKDGSVRFSKTGRPVSRVAKPISDSVTLIRQNFVANLQQYAEQVATERAEDYAKQIKQAGIAGKPIIAHDRAELDKAVQLQLEEAIREAQAEAQAEADKKAEKAEQTEPEKELVEAQ